jgi:hypothetical protein
LKILYIKYSIIALLIIGCPQQGNRATNLPFRFVAGNRATNLPFRFVAGNRATGQQS